MSTTEKHYDIDFVQNYLPHRYPFLLVDRVLSFESEAIKAIKNVSVNEPFFTGHFPVKKIMPGVLIIEALAQAAGILTFHKLGTRPAEENDLFYLAGIDKARFKHMVTPGDQLLLEAEVIRQRNKLWKFSAKATVDGVLACSAELIVMR